MSLSTDIVEQPSSGTQASFLPREHNLRPSILERNPEYLIMGEICASFFGRGLDVLWYIGDCNKMLN
jgi:hypothetical protein